MEQQNSLEELKEENNELKKTLSLLLNKPLIKELNGAMGRINGGEYDTEEEFFKDSPQSTL